MELGRIWGDLGRNWEGFGGELGGLGGLRGGEDLEPHKLWGCLSRFGGISGGCGVSQGFWGVLGCPALTIHGVDGLEGNNFGDPGGAAPQKLVQVLGVVVAEDVLGGPAAQDPLHHGGVVPRVRENVAAWGHPKTRQHPKRPPQNPRAHQHPKNPTQFMGTPKNPTQPPL